MAEAVYKETNRRFRVYRKYMPDGDWVMTESFDIYGLAKDRVDKNMRTPLRPEFPDWYEIWKMEDSQNV